MEHRSGAFCLIVIFVFASLIGCVLCDKNPPDNVLTCFTKAFIEKYLHDVLGAIPIELRPRRSIDESREDFKIKRIRKRSNNEHKTSAPFQAQIEIVAYPNLYKVTQVGDNFACDLYRITKLMGCDKALESGMKRPPADPIITGQGEWRFDLGLKWPRLDSIFGPTPRVVKNSNDATTAVPLMEETTKIDSTITPNIPINNESPMWKTSSKCQ